jgi:hypothetical protein
MDMDTDVEQFTKKTTILFSPALHGQLARLAEQRHSSIGELVREACRAQYGLASSSERLAIVKELAGLSLPVGTTEQMERESVPEVEPIP